MILTVRDPVVREFLLAFWKIHIPQTVLPPPQTRRQRAQGVRSKRLPAVGQSKPGPVAR